MARRLIWVLVGLVAALAVLTPGSSALALSQAGSGLTFTPSPAKAGRVVTTSVDLRVDRSRSAANGVPRCAVTWDGTAIATPAPSCQQGQTTGSVDVSFVVPENASPGTHGVVVTVLGIPFEGTLDVISQVAVPDLVGLTRTEARQRAIGAGLTLCDVPVGIVVSQTLRPGTLVDPGTCVPVVTRPAVFMPNLLGKTLPAARAVVEANGLVLADPGTTDGTVSDQKPGPGVRVFVGETVSVAMTAIHLVTVPDLVGHTVRDATTMVSGAGLRLRDSGSDPDRLVKSQNPTAGSQVAPGRQVTVTLQPPKQVVVPVPDLHGMTLDQARTALVTAQLVLAAQASDVVGDAHVASQSPTAGARVPPGSSIAVTLEAPASLPSSVLITAGAIVVLGLAGGVRKVIKRVWPKPPVVVLLPIPDAAVDAQVQVQVHEADAIAPPRLRLEAHPDWTLDPTVVEVP